MARGWGTGYGAKVSAPKGAQLGSSLLESPLVDRARLLES